MNIDERAAIVVLASGTKDAGGSGFRELISNSRSGILQAVIGAVVCNHVSGGVRRIADTEHIPFYHISNPYDAEHYQYYMSRIFGNHQNRWVMLSGWLKQVVGLDPAITVNIHPGPLPDPGEKLKFGGPGMYGHHVHEACIKAAAAGKLTHSAVSMHFVDDNYDTGPVFFRYPVEIRPDDTADTLAARVNKIEHGWQSWVTNLVVTRQIQLVEGKVIVPDWYKTMGFCPKWLRAA